MEDGPEPLLFVDVNLGSVSERITVMKGDTAESLTEEFSRKHDLDINMQQKLRLMLQQQIDGILEKIDEEDHTSQITGEDSQNPMQEEQQRYEEETKFAPAPAAHHEEVVEHKNSTVV